MRVLIDMNLAHRWVPFLKDATHDATHWSSVGPGSAKDTEICEYARQWGFVIVTNDLDSLKSWRIPGIALQACASPG
jgi:predicted nuclease of predicted toxin-antitoxin system